MSYTSRFVAAAVGLLAMAIVASRQLFLFALLRDAEGLLSSQGGRYHFWLAVSASVSACIAGALLFYFFLNGKSSTGSKVLSATKGTPLTGIQFNNLVTPTPFDVMHWQRLNPWLSEGQADDRTPMDGSVAVSGGSESEQRSLARRTHQLMFKKWSQARHY